ncbi:MAG: conserved phage C-terminal domain-containing protein [Peptoniphilaceae bacterium]|nr:conserved phage C-terminal domain-containing protein [Peptoniphilaceae bacterium]
MSGWIKLYRKLLESPIWRQGTHAQQAILITLLLMANHKETTCFFAGETHTLMPGQIFTTIPKIAKNANATQKEVRSALEKFEKLHFTAVSRAGRGSLITIENWALYQNQEDEKEGKGQFQGSFKAVSGQFQGILSLLEECKNNKNIYILSGKPDDATVKNGKAGDTDLFGETKPKQENNGNADDTAPVEETAIANDTDLFGETIAAGDAAFVGETEPKQDNHGKANDTDLFGETKPKQEIPPYQEIIDYLNRVTGHSYKATTANTKKQILARWREGWRLHDFYKVIDTRFQAWGSDPQMMDYLRPFTLFGPKFESYLQNAENPRGEKKYPKYVKNDTRMSKEERKEWVKKKLEYSKKKSLRGDL